MIPLILISLVLYPFWRRNKYESFKDEIQTKVEFQGKRWTKLEFEIFVENIKNSKTSLEKLQNKLFVVLGDYKRVMGRLENAAYKQKEGLANIPKDLSEKDRKKMMESSGLSSTPIKDFYKPLYTAKKNGFSPINVRSEHDFRKTLPRVAISSLGTLDQEGELTWINEKDTIERYNKEEEFYKSVSVYLPTFLSSVNEILTNVKILRKNAGDTSWGMRPRVEGMKQRADELEKKVKTEEEFRDSKDACPKSIRIRTIKTIPYEYWGQIAKEINSKINTIQDLISASIEDIHISESILENMGRKGEKGKQKAQNAL